MVKMQPYVKQYYDFLEQGKIMGLKCNRCGSYEFPPVTVCDKCGGTDLSWMEMSGEGELITFSVIHRARERWQKFLPYVYGIVAFKEGPVFSGMILGMDAKDAPELYKKLPVKVKAETKDMGGYKATAFRVKE